MKTELLRVQGLSARRNDGCDLSEIYMNLYEGEALGIVGLHDSGKSFFCDCLMGEQSGTEGKIFLYEEPVAARQWKGSRLFARICSVSSLVESCSVMENVFIIRRKRRRKVFVPWNALKQQAAVCLSEFAIAVPPERKVWELTLMERHSVEILKAYIGGARLVILDDIMASYSANDYRSLYQVIQRCQEKGMSFLICGCQLEHLQRLTERCLFLVNGSSVKTMENKKRKQIDEVRILTGGVRTGRPREVGEPKKAWEQGRELFRAEHLSLEAGEDVNFSLKEGEIVVLVDLFQQWFPQLVEALKGRRSYGGRFWVQGKTVNGKSRDIFVTDFLESNYMIESLSFKDNLCLAAMRRISTFGFLHPAQARTVERLFREEYQLPENGYTFMQNRLSFAEKMAVYLQRIRLQSWKVMVCQNIENVMSYELEYMVKQQLREMASARRTICICAGSFEKYMDLADYFLVVTGKGQVERFTYEELCGFFNI